MPQETPLTLTRREFIKNTAQALAASVVASTLPGLTAASPAQAATLPAKPNILILISDQERNPRDWPAGWADTHLNKARQRLLTNGMEFSRAFCNASMCSPSRGSLFTGLYPAQHGVPLTLTEGGPLSPSEPTLSPQLRNLANLLAESGYDVQLRGKWHLSKGTDGGTPSADDLKQFGFNGWVPTNVGEALDVNTLAGGCADMDQPTVDQAVSYLQAMTPAATQTKPFCLVVSLANPHDILAYPGLWNDETCEDDSYKDTANLDMGLSVPDSYSDDLSTKPAVQNQAKQLYALGLGSLLEEQKRLNYVNFYGYLQTIIDAQMDTILQTLNTQGLTNSTVVVRTADHGELGLAHSGLRQKMFNMYEECINIPLIFSNPILFPAALQTTAYAGLVDIVPTLASLCGVPGWKWTYLPGRDLTPILMGTQTQVQDTVLFTFDDEYAGQSDVPPYITEPCHIRCIITKDVDGEWKYARYYDPAGAAAEEYEMYRLKNGAGTDVDPKEMDNLANSASPNYATYAAKRAELAALLAQVEAERLAPVTPPGPPMQGAQLLLMEE
ncbi:sulfatase-like hydrolase/transferase [Desulfovibrio sulfodismutans]|uniref:Sulfatase-like hydrolase/transferase n=1 Tax=Desulfolutivibrio sulfodismutans TaxID=63561 RepID=A0A7K3NGE9_9BACT|nr:sulfatase-like hydrolase/transferase [Desulfolutivibrio sulfodismutans]NDY55261.1 sulfatase-like hydrolase/transferase [Desulfolutivibrio sulfodismutans]QLA12992.1 sulfatase-like hydrolase/transferase [Desulfolutivibrio sulfodismutans DSM 3696]